MPGIGLKVAPFANARLSSDMTLLRLLAEPSADLSSARTSLQGTGLRSSPLGNTGVLHFLFFLLARLLADRRGEEDQLRPELELFHQLVGMPAVALVDDASPVPPGAPVQYSPCFSMRCAGQGVSSLDIHRHTLRFSTRRPPHPHEDEVIVMGAHTPSPSHE